jgi:RHS repeat-associated protein
MCAMYVIEEQNGTTLPESSLGGGMKYLHSDILGSITSVTTQSGGVIARQDFDAWGRRRNPLNYNYSPQNTIDIDRGVPTYITSLLPNWLYRGYTGHEMLNEFGLINMNARLYDPLVGMMLSCDNYVQDASNSQNYNRYAYCLNNPLKYTDPTGNNWEDRMQNGLARVTNPLRKFGDSFNRFQNNITGQTSTYSTGASGGLSPGNAAFSAWGNGAGSSGKFKSASGAEYQLQTQWVEEFKLFSSSIEGENDDWRATGKELYNGAEYVEVRQDISKVDADLNDGRGKAESFSFGFAFVGGISVELGKVTDSYGNSSRYYTVSANFGFGIDFGYNQKEIIPTKAKPFKLEEYEGNGKNLSIGLLLGGESRGGNTSPNFKDFGTSYIERTNSINLNPIPGMPALNITDFGVLYQIGKTSFY